MTMKYLALRPGCLANANGTAVIRVLILSLEDYSSYDLSDFGLPRISCIFVLKELHDKSIRQEIDSICFFIINHQCNRIHSAIESGHAHAQTVRFNILPTQSENRKESRDTKLTFASKEMQCSFAITNLETKPCLIFHS